MSQFVIILVSIVSQVAVKTILKDCIVLLANPDLVLPNELLCQSAQCTLTTRTSEEWIF